jgi:hypothetical protein
MEEAFDSESREYPRFKMRKKLLENAWWNAETESTMEYKLV